MHCWIICIKNIMHGYIMNILSGSWNKKWCQSSVRTHINFLWFLSSVPSLSLNFQIQGECPPVPESMRNWLFMHLLNSKTVLPWLNQPCRSYDFFNIKPRDFKLINLHVLCINILSLFIFSIHIDLIYIKSLNARQKNWHLCPKQGVFFNLP